MKCVVSVLLYFVSLIIGLLIVWMGTLSMAVSVTSLVRDKDLLWPFPVKIFYSLFLSGLAGLGLLVAMKWLAKRIDPYFSDEDMKPGLTILFSIGAIAGLCIMVYAKYCSTANDTSKMFLEGLAITGVSLLAISKEYFSKSEKK